MVRDSKGLSKVGARLQQMEERLEGRRRKALGSRRKQWYPCANKAEDCLY